MTSSVRFSKDDVESENEVIETDNKEDWYCILIQIAIPFILAGFGTLTAGIVLGNVEKWRVYIEIPELFALIPALCGLKGNLDMCVASRLSTHSNLGQIQGRRTISQILLGNVAVVQVQAIVCSVLLAMITTGISSIIRKAFITTNMIILLGGSIFTASISCMVLDTSLMLLILLATRYKCNPDYIATPMVASIGDIVSISLLSFSAAQLHVLDQKSLWIVFIVIVLYISILLPIWSVISARNYYTRHVLIQGWIPVLGALTISQLGGWVLSLMVQECHGFAVFSPIINGVAGNLVCVQASNMGSELHRRVRPGTIPQTTRICEAPHRALFWGSPYARVSRLLITLSVPVNVFLIYLADYIYQGQSMVHWQFVVAYVVTSLVLLLLLLWCAHWVVHLLWKFKLDPDSTAIPYLTATADSLGTSLLAVMFQVLATLGYPYPGQKHTEDY